ncbi:hypothetical protein [Proteiniphilum sp.]|uniref:hypothetical protein n=1 Tax=Proteiniphilum sp. TaxID=1926877 RepID=UPI002B21CB4A|nr:hypothetical protein [Proteiniphilum sp.]MEA4916542.1 hypothetical protein [Proteiniphilum sp.]MEA4948781.1 hypothetical protein [Petrimonas sp.]
MGQVEQVLKEAIQSVAGASQIKGIVSGVAVNVRDTLCDVERDGAPILYDVRLNAIDDDLQSYVTVVPEEKSNVLVAVIENLKTEAVVVRFSEVQKVLLKIGTNTAVMDNNGLVFNDGGISGLAKLPQLVEWMQKVYSDLQTLKTQLQTHPVAGNGSPLALVFNTQTVNPETSDFEDTKIKH